MAMQMSAQNSQPKLTKRTMGRETGKPSKNIRYTQFRAGSGPKEGDTRAGSMEIAKLILRNMHRCVRKNRLGGGLPQASKNRMHSLCPNAQ